MPELSSAGKIIEPLADRSLFEILSQPIACLEPEAASALLLHPPSELPYASRSRGCVHFGAGAWFVAAIHAIFFFCMLPECSKHTHVYLAAKYFTTSPTTTNLADETWTVRYVNRVEERETSLPRFRGLCFIHSSTPRRPTSQRNRLWPSRT